MRALSQWWRSRVLARERARIDSQVWARVWASLPLLAGLAPEQARRLGDLALLFLREKRLEPAQGLALTDAMRLAIALQAALPILELGLDWYRGWYAVILYPDEFVPEHEVVGEDGVVWIEREAKSGEAWEQGPVILSWADVEAGSALDGYNVVIHELAHKLDMLDGAPNGCPPLHAGMSPADWTAALSMAYEDLCRRVDADEQTLIDPYASESPAELFAVVSEYFFARPDLLHAQYPAVYGQLKRFYRQDPLARCGGAPTPAPQIHEA
ncbi:MAG: zinc-dependent peptidase [Sphingobacteriia bacterium]|nr:zinc-dependent peptidase [Sphingobacteriia bacterium]NCC39370.1 zinc-dependent peptidase [Gammaproteobacteria bacterium]